MSKNYFISNSRFSIVSKDEWQEVDYLAFFRQRFSDMKSKKTEIENEFSLCEKQETALSYYNNLGELQVNIPLEQNLIEIYMGRTNGKISFDILPDGQTDVEDLQSTKYALNFFLDGNEKENFWIENKDFRNNKALYGTGVFFTGIRSYKEFQFKVKNGVKLIDGSDIQNKKNFEKIEKERWFFFPKSIHPRDFYVDDKAYNKPGIQNADDCIWRERLSFLEFKMRYEGNNAFNQKEIEKVTTGNDQYTSSISNDEVIIYHYFDRITKTWLIVANEKNLIYNGIYLYDDGKLPFEMTQHYTNPNNIWGRGIPTRIRYLKAYKNEILQDILVGAEMGSGIHLITGNDSQIGQDWEVGGRGVNIWRTVGGANSVQQVNTQPNLAYFTSVIQLLDDLVIQDTGDNLKSPYMAQSDKVGIVEIIEQNKAVRQSSVDENYNIGLDNALTMTLARIKQFAPSLLSEKILNKKGDKIIKLVFPKIAIPNYQVVKKNGKNKFIKNLGKYGYFELKPDVVEGIGVKVVTSSTSSNLPILERQKINDYFSNLSQLINLANMDTQMMDTLKEKIDIEGLITWMNDTFGYGNRLKPINIAKNKEIKQQEENDGLFKGMNELIDLKKVL